MNSKKIVLGRGLSSLFGENILTQNKEDNYKSLPLESITLSPYQPRHHFQEDSIQSLAESIRHKGVLQPLLVRPGQTPETFELIAGERRLRGARAAGLTHVPCHVLEADNQSALETSLLENIQREDLVCIEEAQGYKRLVEEFHYTQEALAERLGKSRSHIANYIRLLQLPVTVQDMLTKNQLTPGHGKVLIGAQDPEALAKIIVQKKLTVRQTEALLRPEVVSKDKSSDPLNSDAKNLATHMSSLIGLPVSIHFTASKGVIKIILNNPLELDNLLNQLSHGPKKPKLDSSC